MATGLGEHQIAELDDQPTLFRNRNEFSGRDQPLVLWRQRAGPQPNSAARGELEHGLIEDLNLFAPDRLAKLDFKDVALVELRP